MRSVSPVAQMTSWLLLFPDRLYLVLLQLRCSRCSVWAHSGSSGDGARGVAVSAPSRRSDRDKCGGSWERKAEQCVLFARCPLRRGTGQNWREGGRDLTVRFFCTQFNKENFKIVLCFSN